MKLWISENNFIELDKSRESLTSEIAPRSRSLDWMGYYGFLPDPDTVLQNLGEVLSTYRQLLTDAHVWACYESRTAGTLSQNWKIDPAAEGGSARPNKKAYELANEVMKSLDVRQVTEDILQAVFYGMSPIEVVWKTGTQWLPDRVVGKPPEWFGFNESNELRFQSLDNMTQGEPIPDYKFLLSRHHASYKNPYGERALSRCFWPVAFKKGGFKFWAIFTEKFGMPWLVGKVPKGTNDTERTALLANLASMVQDAVAVINDDESVDITEASGKKASADIYDQLIAAGNHEISKAILGQTGTTEGTPGRLGNETSHMEVRQDLIDGDKKMVCGAFNRLFAWVAELNVDGAAPPTFSFIEEEDVQKDRAERDKTLNETGVKFRKKYFQRVYNLEEDDFDIFTQTDPEPGPAATEFADSGEDDSPGDVLDALGDKTLTRADLGGLTAPVEKLLNSVDSLEEFRDGLLDLYKDMDESKLGDLMAQALAVAELAGRFDASER